MKNAILVRVGIDQTEMLGVDQTTKCKGWNAPVNPKTGEFAYVPILETGGHDGEKKIRPGYKVSYEQFKAPCENLGMKLPPRFDDEPAHLDPDFRYLTYGDEYKKAAQLEKLGLVENDMLAFYAGLSPPNAGPRELIYALIGLYVLVDKPIHAEGIKEDWYRNAHTRREPKEDDIVFFGKEGKSGRLEKCIPIGEYRLDKGGYYVEKELCRIWGGLSSDYLQRSGGLPRFCDPEKFYEWFRKECQKRNIRLVKRNNLD